MSFLLRNTQVCVLLSKGQELAKGHVFVNVLFADRNNRNLIHIFLHQGVDMDRDWKLIPFFIQMNQLCVCDPQQVTK